MSELTATASLLVRRPPSEVFAALVEPRHLSAFWLADASAPLAAGRTVRWQFRVAGAAEDTRVADLVADRLIAIEWSEGQRVRFSFEDRGDGTTRVAVEQTGFSGAPAEATAAALEATQGFTLVLCDLKVYLETGASPGITRDKAILIEEAQSQ
jgi:uncharacterized protein YndB with AHSA1/START domain